MFSKYNRKKYDLIIKGGTIVDGTGLDSFIADIGIKGDVIIDIGDLDADCSLKSICASGKVVSPGFIDVHSHTDEILLINPKADSKIFQGVTTEVCGNCGYSAFPVGGESRDELCERLLKNYGIDLNWDDLDGFFNSIEKKGISLNLATLTGHGTLRGVSMGLGSNTPSNDDMKKMKYLLNKSMEQGSFGLSSGLEYSPSAFAAAEEITELCKEVKRNNGIYTTHMRSEGDDLENSLEEALQVARSSGVELQISHLKAYNKKNWYKMSSILEKLLQAAKNGISVNCDRYPYTASFTVLTHLLPIWSREGTRDNLIKILKDEEKWRKIKYYLDDKMESIGTWDAIQIACVKSEKFGGCQGKTILNLAKSFDMKPEEFIRQLLIDAKGLAEISVFAMDESNTEKVLAFPLTMIGSDGAAFSPKGILSRSCPHPRYYGTYPKFIGDYVRQKKIMSLTSAVKKMTSMPAEKFNIRKRGFIRKNYYADIVVFNLETVIDKAKFDDPHKYPEGIDYVIVNGIAVIEKGKHSGNMPGRVLRKL